MTRKDYQLLAQFSAKAGLTQQQLFLLTGLLEAQNPKFKVGLFERTVLAWQNNLAVQRHAG